MERTDPPPPEQPGPARRLIAAGIRVRVGTRTLTVRATTAGVTGTIRADELHHRCRADYQAAARHRPRAAYIDAITSANEAVAVR
ncbi:hypothetical protein ABTZ78_17195 [Streptomyces bauhiniae]|uniref:hypothetical protein n=1 Tax=Streptomyces bauhiniae TaxID=2340725 RepID=UPI00332EBB3E